MQPLSNRFSRALGTPPREKVDPDSIQLPSQPDSRAIEFVSPPEMGWLGQCADFFGVRRWQEPRLNTELFEQRYIEAVRSRLSDPEVEMKTATQALEVALELLPPLVGVRLAGAVAQALTTPKDDQRIARRCNIDRDFRPDEKVDAQIRQCLEGSDHPLPSRCWRVPGPGNQALSYFGEIALGGGFLKETGFPLRAFVVGHESSHNRHRDHAAALGYEALGEMVEERAPRLSASFERDLREIFHAHEFRCDREGKQLALSQGVSAAELLEQVDGLLRYEVANSTHPDGRRRLDALKEP